MIKMTMKTGLSGPKVALSRGDPYDCDDHLEAARLDRAGFAALADGEDPAPLEKAHADLAKAAAKKG